MPIKILKDMSPHEKTCVFCISQTIVDVVMHSWNVSDMVRLFLKTQGIHAYTVSAHFEIDDLTVIILYYVEAK